MLPWPQGEPSGDDRDRTKRWPRDGAQPGTGRSGGTVAAVDDVLQTLPVDVDATEASGA